MAKQVINTGTAANSKNGDPLRTAFTKVNANFDELYSGGLIPTQTGNSGKFLTTSGTVLSWAVGSGGTTDYNNLTNKPTIPAAQVQTDWNAVSGLGVVLNKPALFSGSYTDLTNKPTIPGGVGDFVFTNGSASLPLGDTMTLNTYQNGGNKESKLTLAPTGDSALDVGGGLRVRTFYGTGFEKSWTFGTDGSVTFPNNTTQTTAWTGSVSSLVNGANTVSLDNGGLDLTFTSGEKIKTTFGGGIELYRSGDNTIGIYASGAEIKTFATGGAKHTWTFGTDGGLTLPGSIIGTVTQNVFNTTSTTVNAFGAATTLNIGAAGGTTTIAGDLTVSGTTTTINATTLTVDDKNIELGSVVTPTNTTADGGGISLKGATDKTFNWVNATGAWTSSEDLNLLTGKVYEIDGTTVLSSTTLGSGVTLSSLTTVGTIGTGVWNGTVVAGQYGGTGVANTGKTITLGGNLTTSGAFATTFTSTATTDVTLPTTGTLATLAGTETLTNKTITAPKIDLINDANGNEILGFSTTASAVDYLVVKNGIGAGVPPHFYADGSSTNIGIHIQPKGTGLVTISDGTDFNKGIRFRSSSSASSAVTLIDAVSTAGRVITLPDATDTLVARATTDTLSNKTAGVATTTSTAASVGYIGMPQNSKSANYELIIGDMGKHVYVTANSTVTVPAYTSVDFPIGTTIAVVAGIGATVSIAITTDTMNLAGSGTTGTRTLAPFGMATLVKVAQSTWFISGVGLT